MLPPAPLLEGHVYYWQRRREEEVLLCTSPRERRVRCAPVLDGAGANLPRACHLAHICADLPYLRCEAWLKALASAASRAGAARLPQLLENKSHWPCRAHRTLFIGGNGREMSSVPRRQRRIC